MSGSHSDITDDVREHYSKVAKGERDCCGSDTSCCSISEQIGYSKEDLESLPKEAEMGLGCGNPISFAGLKLGEVVLDLGSGGGVDCFLASKIVGATGKVIGVDMTPEMTSKARKNAVSGNYQNVEFRLGEIEHLPAGDSTVDAVISNCVINLSPSKLQVYKEAHRVLKPGGRLAVADMIALQPLPDHLKNDVAAYTGASPVRSWSIGSKPGCPRPGMSALKSTSAKRAANSFRTMPLRADSMIILLRRM